MGGARACPLCPPDAAAAAQGVLLFIDEADAFLRRRKAGDGGSSTAEHMRAAINAVLARTGTQSSKFMMVLASNRPEDLDPAVLDRIDDTIHFPLPGDTRSPASPIDYLLKHGTCASLTTGVVRRKSGRRLL